MNCGRSFGVAGLRRAGRVRTWRPSVPVCAKSFHCGGSGRVSIKPSGQCHVVANPPVRLTIFFPTPASPHLTSFDPVPVFRLHQQEAIVAHATLIGYISGRSVIHTNPIRSGGGERLGYFIPRNNLRVTGRRTAMRQPECRASQSHIRFQNGILQGLNELHSEVSPAEVA